MAARGGNDHDELTVAVGDRFRDPALLGSPCAVTAVDPEGCWFEARWIPGAPAYRYPTGYARRLVKVDPPVVVEPTVEQREYVERLLARKRAVLASLVADPDRTVEDLLDASVTFAEVKAACDAAEAMAMLNGRDRNRRYPRRSI